MKDFLLNAWIRQTVALVLLVPLLAAGCAGVTQRKMNEEGLREAVVKFNDALRWRDYQHAILWVASPQQEDFWRQTEACRIMSESSITRSSGCRSMRAVLRAR